MKMKGLVRPVVNYLARNTPARKTASSPGDSAMANAFLAALRERVKIAGPSEQINLPTGPAESGEIARVLEAIGRARR